MTDTSATDSVAIYLRLLRRVWPHRRIFAIGVVAMVILGLTEPAIPAIFKNVIGSFENREFDRVPLYAAFFLGMFFIRGLSQFFSVLALDWVASRLVMDLRQDMFKSLIHIPTPAYDEVTSGSLISKVMFDVQQVTQAAVYIVTVLVRDTVAVIGLLGWMLWLDWKLTLIAVVTAPVITAVVIYFGRRLRQISYDLQNAMGNVTHVLQESIEGHKVVRIFSGHRYETRRFVNAVNHIRRLQIKSSATSTATPPIAQMLIAMALTVILWLSAQRFETGDITLADFAGFFTAMALLFSPLKRLTGINARLQKGIAAAISVFGLIDAPVEVDTGSVRLSRAEGRLEFESVTFRYRDTEGPVLDAVSITVEPGEAVALVGPSGSGKTTIAEMIPRLYDPDSGHIKLDGIELRDLTLESLRANIAFVGQDIILFDDTVAANIAYGSTADVSRDAIITAARAAHALEFIEAMPHGLDTFIGERGVKLSGGQRQRLAIARAILKDAPVLILDEATSSLDNESERHVREAVDTLRTGRTMITIAHRLSTIEAVDRIIVVDRGRIMDVGTHVELLERSVLYAELYRLHQYIPHHEDERAVG